MLDGPSARVVAPLAILGGAITEWVVLGELGGQLSWAKPLVIVLGVAAAVALALRLSPRARMIAVAVAVAALFAAPATWAAQTLGHATSSTFPTGGPASAANLGSGGPGGRGGFGGPGGSGAGRFGAPPGMQGGAGFAPPSGGARTGFAPPSSGTGTGFAGGGGPGGFGGDNATLTAAIDYAKAHGGGTIGVSSQSSAADAILSSNGDVAGLGGFSGRESSVTVKWLASEVAAGRLRWVIVDSNQGGGGLSGDTRTGSQTAMDAIAKSCKAVTLKTSTGTATMYDCSGQAAAILAAAGSGGN
jgi:hypothetical protein